VAVEELSLVAAAQADIDHLFKVNLLVAALALRQL
jgi:hypothetical protein